MEKEYSNKSYVGLAACPICGKDSGVLMDRRLKETFENGKRYALTCAKCEEHLSGGNIFLIEVRDGETGKEPYRTGHLVGLSKDWAERNGIEDQVSFIQESELKQIMGDAYKVEKNGNHGERSIPK